MSINKIIKGYQEFYSNYEKDEDHLLKKLQASQTPSTLIIACSDSRVDPAIITNANYGDIFVIRNVANIIPPFEDKHNTHHGTSSAIEYAVKHLEVDNIIIMGHSNCGGIKALLDTDFAHAEDSFIKYWIELMAGVKETIPSELEYEEKRCCCEKEGVKQSIKNALTFDFVKERHDSGKLKILGWWFDIKTGKMYQYDGGSDAFIDLSTHEHEI